MRPPSASGDTAGTKPDPLAELARIVGPGRPLSHPAQRRSRPVSHRHGTTPDMDAVFAYGHDETMPQNRDQHQDPQSLPDWRTQWREEEGGRREDFPSGGNIRARTRAHGNAGPGIHAPAGHSRDQGLRLLTAMRWRHGRPPQRSVRRTRCKIVPARRSPHPDTTGGVAGDEDAPCFARNPQVHANRHTGEDLLQPRPAPPVPPHSSQPAASAPALRDRTDSPVQPIHRATLPWPGFPCRAPLRTGIHSGRMRMPMSGAYDGAL